MLAELCALAEMAAGMWAYSLDTLCVSAENVPAIIQSLASALHASAEIAGAM